MKTGSPEFSRTVRIDTLGAAPRALSIGADEQERRALAERFGLVGIEHLTAEASLTRSGDEVKLDGSLSAAVTQSCVATDAPVPERIEEEFTILFRPLPQGDGPEEEIELSESEMDVAFYDGGAVDIGEAVAETLSLSLNPYPRSPEAEAALKEAGVLSEEEAKPAGALAGLKDLLAGKRG